MINECLLLLHTFKAKPPLGGNNSKSPILVLEKKDCIMGEIKETHDVHSSHVIMRKTYIPMSPKFMSR